jgi:hypothetical protein
MTPKPWLWYLWTVVLSKELKKGLDALQALALQTIVSEAQE